MQLIVKMALNCLYILNCRIIYIIFLLLIPLLCIPLIFLITDEEKHDAGWVLINGKEYAVSFNEMKPNAVQHFCKRNNATALNDRSISKQLKLKDGKYWNKGCMKTNGEDMVGCCIVARPICVKNEKVVEHNYECYKEAFVKPGTNIKSWFILMTPIVINTTDINTIPVECAKIISVPAYRGMNLQSTRRTNLNIFGYEQAGKAPYPVTCNKDTCTPYTIDQNLRLPFTCDFTHYQNLFLGPTKDECYPMKRIENRCYAMYNEVYTKDTGYDMCAAVDSQMVDFEDAKHRKAILRLSSILGNDDWSNRYWTNDGSNGTYVKVKKDGYYNIQEPNENGIFAVFCYYTL